MSITSGSKSELYVDIIKQATTIPINYSVITLFLKEFINSPLYFSKKEEIR